MGFPSHIGSRSTEIIKVVEESLAGFHPTLVLAQPEKGEKLPVLDTFPSHIGSRSTVRCRKTAPYTWFPSHIGSRSTYRPD